MKYFLLFLSLFTILNCQDKKNVEETLKSDNRIVFGQIDSIYSEVLNESRKIWVHLPAGALDDTFSKTKYPVLYLLDGPGHFYSVTGMIKQLSTTNGNTVVPEMIIVAIPNTNRTRDLTPTNTETDPFGGDTAWLNDSGGGETFNDFVEKELIPYIDKNYPTSSYRTYVGHSFGGLAVINTLLTRPELFDNYIAIDPSLWWDDQVILKKAATVFSESRFDKKGLYLGIANTMPDGMKIEDVVKDTTGSTLHVRSNLEFAKLADSHEDNGLSFDWKYYDNDTHGSVPLITEYDAMRILFSWYDFKEINKFFDPDIKVTPEEFKNTIDTHYKKVSEHFGYDVLPNEGLINSLGYGFMTPDKFDLSYAALQMNIENYPESSNVYDSMGDYYLATKDSVKALELFTKAIEVGPSTVSQEKIDILTKSLK
jgi:predicted alpha/beta superfamily hydrolase